jgi:hypothetical protein
VPPTQLRDLSARRRKALDAALATSQELARGRRRRSDPALLDEVEGTLAAAMADEAAAETVRSGRVLKPLRYSGFGDGLVAATTTVPRTSGAARSPSARASSPSAPVHTGAPQPSEEELAARREEAQARVAAAERTVDEPPPTNGTPPPRSTGSPPTWPRCGNGSTRRRPRPAPPGRSGSPPSGTSNQPSVGPVPPVPDRS